MKQVLFATLAYLCFFVPTTYANPCNTEHELRIAQELLATEGVYIKPYLEKYVVHKKSICASGKITLEFPVSVLSFVQSYSQIRSAGMRQIIVAMIYLEQEKRRKNSEEEQRLRKHFKGHIAET